ncbi:hypothetical protein J3E68DRAFT_393846 [Trichoderma sp. SZMC 28012]
MTPQTKVILFSLLVFIMSKLLFLFLVCHFATTTHKACQSIPGTCMSSAASGDQVDGRGIGMLRSSSKFGFSINNFPINTRIEME